MLLACIGLDMLGNASYLLPGFGESLDVAFAPASAMALQRLFNGRVAALNFVEEILPGTDLLPSACIGWACCYVFPDTWIARLLGLEGGPDAFRTPPP